MPGRRGPVARNLLTVGPVAAGNVEALSLPGDLSADIYQDDVFVSNRATIGFSGDTTFEGPVTRVDLDSAETVGPRSFVFKSGAGAIADKIYAWDVDGAALHDYEIPATTRATTPVYRDGFLWWLEWPIAYAATVSVLLKKSRCDLSTDLATVHTFSVDERNGNAGGARVELIVPLDGDLFFLWRMSNEDGEQWYRCFSKDYSTGNAVNTTADVLTTQFGATMESAWAQVDPNIGQAFFGFGAAVYDASEGKAYVAWHPSQDWPGPGTDPWAILWSMDSPLGMTAVWTSSEGTGSTGYKTVSRLGDLALVQGPPIVEDGPDVFIHPVPDPGAFPEVSFGSDVYYAFAL